MRLSILNRDEIAGFGGFLGVVASTLLSFNYFGRDAALVYFGIVTLGFLIGVVLFWAAARAIGVENDWRGNRV